MVEVGIHITNTSEDRLYLINSIHHCIIFDMQRLCEKNMNLKQRAKQLKKDIPAVFLAMKKRETPWYSKAMAVLTIGYALSPIDLIPDFVPVLGYLDDVILLPLMVSVTIHLIPKDIMVQCRSEAELLWQDGRPKKLYYALLIVSIWLLVIFLVVIAFL